ncbi:hypothetical protein [Mesobacterium pallidum]|uniref:hypothetical protein n=1 Tax=Mesobacterium pallidum TaxID=2872037 RepID=UPI001EE3787A|nr:hypothetical protein [Mesobacterium pallidum]
MAFALVLLSACSGQVEESVHVARLESVAAVGGEYAGVREVLLRQGYAETRPSMGPQQPEWSWDRCLTTRVRYPLSMTGAEGARWVCMQLDPAGRITARQANYFVAGR